MNDILRKVIKEKSKNIVVTLLHFLRIKIFL